MFYTFIWKSIIINCFVLIKQLEILFFNQNKRTKQINFKFLFLKLFQFILSFLFEWLYLGNHQHFIKHARRKNNNYQQKKKIEQIAGLYHILEHQNNQKVNFAIFQLIFENSFV